MQIVIDISEDVYTRLFDNGIQDNEIAVDDVCEMARALRLGKPLPKRHGRIIDESKIKNCGWNFIDHHAKTDAPTIIEADKCTYNETGCGSCKRQLDCPIEAEGSESE